MELKVNFNEFIKELDKLLSLGVEFNKKSNFTNEDNIDELKKEINGWVKTVFDFLNKSFSPENNEFAISFHNSFKQRFNVGNQQKSFVQIKTELFEDLNERIKTLNYYKKILNISDVITKPKDIDLEKRKSFTTEEILDLILEKLYLLYDNTYHSIKMILKGNGIEIKRYGEEREYAKLLEEYGYVNLMHTRDVLAQLSTEGKIYVENKKKIEEIDYDKISNSKEEIHEKINEIIETLSKLGLGQEVLFEELEDLKDLYGKIDKKNWGQLLKGKLIDLGLSQVINMDTVNMIYKELTKQLLNLP
jgi:hypothetical protein